MLVLVITVCAINAPSQCGEARLQFAADEPLSPIECSNRAMPYLAQYVGEHPNIRVKKWRCDFAEKEGKPA